MSEKSRRASEMGETVRDMKGVKNDSEMGETDRDMREVTDMIFVKYFTHACTLTFRNLPKENAYIATFLVPLYDNLAFLILELE